MSRRADAPTPAPSPRRIPQVDRVLQALADAPVPRPLVAKAVRAELARLRESGGEIPEFEALAAGIRADLERMARRRILPVINATGVIIHTNLGRSPLSPRAADAAREVAASYCNLEIDLNTGKRGPRAGFLEACLAELCQAEAATVVNNCAAALVLILRHFALGKEVIISRGELVEIGGGFRIPEIMAASGARLREVGATNKTHLDDYRRAIGPDTGMILKVHKSNFYIEGFTAEAPPQELAKLAREHGIPFVEDLGSGAVVATDERAPVEHEPLPGEVLARGVDVVCFSGDKLFGGPQAGIIAGKAGYIAGLKKEPFFRALRCDKMIMAALQETALEYLENGGAEVATIAMLAAEPENLKARAEAVAARLRESGADADAEIAVGEAPSQIGGGTLPRSAIPSAVLALKPNGKTLDQFAEALRAGENPTIGYVADGWMKFDFRTVFERQDRVLEETIIKALS